MEQKKYGLFTGIAMITGIVIGSGIFFKSDNILLWTNGNVIQGVMIFLIAAIAIIFGSLTISQLAARTDNPGGIIAYAEEFCGIPISCAFGWFQSFLYLPSITAVVAWVAGIYICILFPIPETLENQILLGAGLITILYLFNILSAKLGGYIQNTTMLIKLIPLFIIAIAGILLGNPVESLSYTPKNVGTLGILSAIPPIAFSFDGWAISTSICHEIKESKKNLPRALIISPILILIIYVAYFVGISSLVGPDKIMEMGDAHVQYAANLIWGGFGAKLILIFVIISVLGTVNGIILGSIRLPYALAIRNMIPGSKILRKENKHLGDMPVHSALLAYAISLFMLFLHYITQKYHMLYNSDISEISIVTNYLGYIILYLAVIRLAKRGEIKNIWYGYIFPTFAILGAFIILFGGMKNPLFLTYFIICGIMITISILYALKNKDKIK